jgi:hypothetical protein
MNWSAARLQFLPPAALALTASLVRHTLQATLLYRIAAADAEGLSTMILLLGGIYSVIFAFVIFVVWGQFTDIENLVTRECNSLTELLRHSWALSGESGRTIRRAVADYAHRVHKSEWRALAARRRDKQMDQVFAEIGTQVIAIVPATPQDDSARRQLMEIARQASAHRDERLSKSLTRIPGTLLRLLLLLSWSLVLLVYVYPFRSDAIAIPCWLGVFFILTLAWVVMTDTDNPFSGVCNVSPEPFATVAAG